MDDDEADSHDGASYASNSSSSHDDDDDHDGDEDFGHMKHDHHGIPSWEEALSVIIESNMEARARNPQAGGPPGRRGGRGGRGGGRGRGR
jgi:hypothetical protein